MAGQWQREFFLITEDPFTDDRQVYNLWLEGYPVKEAEDVRKRHFDIKEMIDVVPVVPGSQPSSAIAGGQSSQIDPAMASSARPRNDSQGLSTQFSDLLRQDCAQQYEAFEFLEVALHDPVHFLQFCPVHLEVEARRHFVESYYNLDSLVAREILKHCNGLSLKAQQWGSDAKSVAVLERIARATNERYLKVQRIIMNLQRACLWVEQALDWQGRHNNRSFLAFGDRDEERTSEDRVREFEVRQFLALGELSASRYRVLTYVLLLRFDLSGKGTLQLQLEHIEDVAAVLLASGGQPFSVEGQRDRVGELLAPDVYDGALFSWVCENLRALAERCLKPKLQAFEALLLQEFERPAAHETDARLSEETKRDTAKEGELTTPIKSAPPSKRFGGRGLFARGGVEPFKAKIQAMVVALLAALGTITSQAAFTSFFDKLADFTEKLRQLDPEQPLDVFQRLFNALEALIDNEKAVKGWTQSSQLWLDSWQMFLEMYRACVACILYSHATGTSPNRDQALSNLSGAGNWNNPSDTNSDTSPRLTDRQVSGASVNKVINFLEPECGTAVSAQDVASL